MKIERNVIYINFFTFFCLHEKVSEKNMNIV